MSAYVHTTSATTRQPMLVVATEPVTGTSLLEAAYGGKVQFSKVRGTGTLRHWPVLAKGSAQRKAAEAIQSAVAKDGVSATAKANSVSVATLRRTLTALAFTLELEAMSAKDRAALAKAANSNRTVAAAAKPAPKEEKAEKAEKAEAPKEETPKATPKATQGTKSPAKAAAPAKRKSETPGQRIKRMQAEGKAPVKSPSQES